MRAVGIAILPVLVFFIVLPIVIGIYVYRDASRRGMNAVLWTLVAILAPSLIGLIIYLLVRGNYSDLRCPRCDTPIEEQYIVCPGCGAKLRASCPSCAAPVEPDWKVCPRCTQPLTGYYSDIVAPERPKDKVLWKILVAVIVIPILLIVLIVFLVLGLRIYSPAGGLSFTAGEVALEELYRKQETSDVREWIESLDEDGRTAYAMQYEEPASNGEMQYYYLLYVPDMGAGSFSDTGVQSGIFTDTLRVELESGDQSQEIAYCMEVTTGSKLKFEVYYEGRKLDCEISEVDFNPIVDWMKSVTEG